MTGILQSLLGSISSAAAVVTDAYFNLVTLLLPGNGTNGAQNNTFLDSSSNNFTITRNGNTTQGTFSPFSQTGWSNYFDGNGDYLSIADNAAFEFGSGDFCVELFSYITSVDTEGTIFAGTWNTPNRGWVFGYIGGTAELDFNYSTNGTNSTSTKAVVTLPLNQWVHFAACRSGNTLSTYMNGSRVATRDVTGVTIFAPNQALEIGRLTESTSNWDLIGYMSNFRIVKGSSVYDPTQTSITVPTSPLTAITNTSVLTCQSNRFIDNSTNALAITRNGDVSVQAFSPFAPTAAYSAATVGGSGYFDGTGDYLSAASNAAFALGSGNFTMEMWVYSGANGTGTRLGGNGTGGSWAANRWIIATSTATSVNKFVFAVNNATPAELLVSTSTFNNNQWMHVAIARSGNAWGLWVNGAREAYVASNSAAVDGGSSEVFNLGFSNLSGDSAWAGYVSGFKMVKGTAVYDPTSTTITVPTAPPTNTTNTSLLCNFTNAGITDATAKNDLETVGNAQISTTQSKFGGSSMYFDGTGDWLLLPASPNMSMGSGDFTWEAWIYFASGSTFRQIFSTRASDATASTTAASFSVNTTNGLTWFTNTAIISYATSIGTSQWVHVAVSRSGTTLRVFANGTSVGSATNSDNLTANIFSVGANNNGSEAFNGYIDDVRITKGYARYTANFTPPTAALPLQ